jgi:hypothetical protein
MRNEETKVEDKTWENLKESPMTNEQYSVGLRRHQTGQADEGLRHHDNTNGILQIKTQVSQVPLRYPANTLLIFRATATLTREPRRDTEYIMISNALITRSP